jgi:asparagine synthase (glutamine-hydrolysing)
MRRICHLHLTRFVRVLLDRKDRASMAVGLEVRVPFCDHRLVEYVYNTPWALKSFDGREKSLLREVTADVIPKSVYDRVKSPYPSTQETPSARPPSKTTPRTSSPGPTTRSSTSLTGNG